MGTDFQSRVLYILPLFFLSTSGDDFLQMYDNHSLLGDDDENLFTLHEAYEAIGGLCEQVISNSTIDGPPVGLTEPIPSNLEVDPNMWFSNEITFSPVWEPPVADTDSPSFDEDTNAAITEIGSTTIASCYDENSSSVSLTVTFKGVLVDEMLPWMAIAYREDEECLMTPRGGGDAPIVLVMGDGSSTTPQAYHGMLSSTTKSFDDSADGVTGIYRTLQPLAEVDGYSSVSVSFGSDTASVSSVSAQSVDDLQLRFKQIFTEGAPEIMYLNYAIGSSPQLGYHKSRECFAVTEFPSCSSGSASEGDETEEDGDETSASTRSNVLASVAAMLSMIIGLQFF
jgi:hypothetical protein